MSPPAPALDARAREVLRVVVQRYLQEGAPIGSRTLAGGGAIPFSSATIRNVMADLEDVGFLISPHTSAGRIPSPGGIRFFIDQLLTVTPPPRTTVRRLQNGIRRDTLTEAHHSAASALSQLTRYVGFVAAPSPHAPVIRRLRFIKLSSSRVLAVIVTENGDVQNRVFMYEDIVERDLNAAARTYNGRFAGKTFEEAQKMLQAQVLDIRGQIGALLRALLQRMEEESATDNDTLRVAGEANLLRDDDLSCDMQKLRALYDLLERKRELIRLLKRGAAADNVRVFVGSESGLAALDDCSVVFSTCAGEQGKPLGLIGVVGPKRMRYNQVIATVDVAAKLLGNALQDLRC